MLKIDDFKHTLSFLKEDIGFFKLFLFYKLVGNVCQFEEKEGDFVLVYFDFLVIKPMEAIIFIPFPLTLIWCFLAKLL